jgi:putative membrane protein
MDSLWSSAAIAYLHYLSFMVAFAALVVEHLTLRKELELKQAWRLVITDGLYGIAAITVLVTGILRVLYFGKGTAYYLSNPVFHLKVGFFILVGLLSLYPTISFLLWLKPLRQGQVPTLELAAVQRLTWVIRAELAFLSGIPLLAAMMARGIGLDWVQS